MVKLIYSLKKIGLTQIFLMLCIGSFGQSNLLLPSSSKLKKTDSDTIISKKITTAELLVAGASVESLEVTGELILNALSFISVNDLVVLNSGTFGSIQSPVATFGTAGATTGNITTINSTNLNSTNGDFTNLDVDNLMVNTSLILPTTASMSLNNLTLSGTGTIHTLNSNAATINSLSGSNITLSGQITTPTANITNLNIENFTSDHTISTNAQITNELTAENISATDILAETLSVDNEVTANDLVLNSLTGLGSKPLFVQANKKVGVNAIGYHTSIPAAAFIPQLISPVDNAASPLLGQIAINSGNEVQGYGQRQYALIAPLSFSLNHESKNILIKDFEVCGIDRNASLNLWVELHESGVNLNNNTLVSNVKMRTNTTGSANNYNCWKANPPIINPDDFDLDHKNYSYWIKVYPRNSNASVNDPFGEFEVWPSVTSGVDIMKLVEVRIGYSFK